MNQEPVTPIPVDGIPGFWGDLRSARASLLALDYDGTLAPFSTVRMEARPLEGSRSSSGGSGTGRTDPSW